MYQGTNNSTDSNRNLREHIAYGVLTITPDWEHRLLQTPEVSALYYKRKEGTMYQGTKNSFALPVELTAKFFGLQYRNRTDDIKITFIVAVGALFSLKKCVSLLQWLATSIVSLKLVPIIKDIRRRPSRIYPFSALGHVCNYLLS